MKKLLMGVSTALLTVILCMAFAGCASKVSGKTYEYDKYEITYTDDANDAVKKLCDTAVAAFTKGMSGTTIEFKKDGKAVLGVATYDYKQDGKTVTIKNGETKVGEYKVSGKNLKATLSAKDLGGENIAGLKSLTVIYKQK